MRNFKYYLVAGAALVLASTLTIQNAKAVEVTDVMAPTLAVGTAASTILPGGYFGFMGMFVAMTVGCEVAYKAYGQKCVKGTPPAPSIGYNQLRGLAPMPDGSIVKTY